MSIDHGKVLALAERVAGLAHMTLGKESREEREAIERELRALAQPAEAVEGLREFIAAQRPLPADMAAFVSENWHKYADFPNPPTDAAQGAVAPDDTCVICPACAHQFRAIPMQVQSLLLAAGYSPPFYTHPQAAPAQGGE